MSEQITYEIVPEENRLNRTAELFGMFWPLQIEPTIFSVAEQLCSFYKGGLWQFVDLSNNGFFMYPLPEENTFFMQSPNTSQETMSAFAFGVTVCQFTYSHLSFSQNERLSNLCTQQYHLVRDFTAQLPEAKKIFRILD